MVITSASFLEPTHPTRDNQTKEGEQVGANHIQSKPMYLYIVIDKANNPKEMVMQCCRTGRI